MVFNHTTLHLFCVAINDLFLQPDEITVPQLFKLFLTTHIIQGHRSKQKIN